MEERPAGTEEAGDLESSSPQQGRYRLGREGYALFECSVSSWKLIVQYRYHGTGSQEHGMLGPHHELIPTLMRRYMSLAVLSMRHGLTNIKGPGPGVGICWMMRRKDSGLYPWMAMFAKTSVCNFGRGTETEAAAPSPRSAKPNMVITSACRCRDLRSCCSALSALPFLAFLFVCSNQPPPSPLVYINLCCRMTA